MCIFPGRSSVVFIVFSKETMTHQRLRTILVQPPHIIGEEIESREENVCLRSHSQNQTPGVLTPSTPGWFPESGSSYLEEAELQILFPMPSWLAWI